jgi:RNA polymerase sigma-70 factor (ECF subfamily)
MTRYCWDCCRLWYDVAVLETGADVDPLLALAAAGDAGAWGALLSRHGGRLQRMVAFRLDPRLRGRVDALDVVQDAFLQAADHRPDYFRQPAPVSLFLWLRRIVVNTLHETHRHHLGTRMRDAGREVAGSSDADATSVALLARLTGHAAGPGTAAAAAEAKDRLREALAGMGETDREVLALRHFEQLSNGETAAVLGIQERAAKERYVRAMRRSGKPWPTCPAA